MDKDSFEQVYIQYHKVVYAYLLSLCRSEELAADLAQETFYKALRGIDRFQGEPIWPRRPFTRPCGASTGSRGNVR